MLIDMHVHARFTASLVEDASKNHRPLGHELVAMLDAAGIDKAVVLCAVSPECRAFWDTPEDVVAVCRKYPDRLIPFCSLDPRMVGNRPDSDFGFLLDAYKKAGCKGVGEYIANLAFDDPLQMNVFRHVADAGIPLTIHVATRIGGMYGCYDDLGLPRLERVLKTFPKLTVLGHSQAFWSEISADVTEQTRGGYPVGKVTAGRVVQLMRSYPNLHGDLSARSGYNAMARDPEFGYAFLEEFQDRLFFGTDIALTGQELPLVGYFRELKAERRISAEAYEKIAWKNANRLLGLGLAS